MRNPKVVAIVWSVRISCAHWIILAVYILINQSDMEHPFWPLTASNPCRSTLVLVVLFDLLTLAGQCYYFA